jgi:DNA polymerase-4
VTLKVRYDDFTTVTRSVTPGGVIDSARDLYVKATDLMGTVDPGRPVRLLGLGGSGLESSNEPRQLLMDTDPNWVRVADAVAEVRERFGEHSVEPARLLGRSDSDDELDG